jgi:hypothetical protein
LNGLSPFRRRDFVGNLVLCGLLCCYLLIHLV